MKRYLVGMLAVLSLAGCGLEMNESFDENGELVETSLEAGWPISPSVGGVDGGALGGPGLYPVGDVAYGASAVVYGLRELPQDPVPVKPGTSSHTDRPGTPDW